MHLSANFIFQTESVSILAGLLDDGVGATILPRSAAIATAERVQDTQCYRISNPNLLVNMAIEISGQLPLSEYTTVVGEKLTELSQRIAFETVDKAEIR